MTGRLSRVSDTWFSVAAGLFCMTWALLAWLTLIPNQDLLADGIQVQSVLQSPHLVLAFPGQKHGGTLEYGYGLLAEWVAPGNYSLHSVVRLVMAFCTGFFASRLYRTYFPTARRWSFLAAVAVGPTILHGIAGPTANPVGVWWLNANYDLAWMLMILGFWLLGRQLRSDEAADGGWRMLGAGVVIGLGFYQQPTVGMLLMPMLVLTVLVFRIRVRGVVLAAAGFAVGIVPSAISYVINAKVNTWDPSHFPIFQPQVALASLGLDGIPLYSAGLLPYALGLAPTEQEWLGRVQSGMTGIFIAVVLVCSVVGGLAAVRAGRRVSSGTAMAITWVAAVLAILAFGTVVNPVWFYASVLAVLLWMGIGVLPQTTRSPRAGAALAIVVLMVVGTSTLVQNVAWYRDILGHIAAKSAWRAEQAKVADALLALGVTHVYGSYYDAIPVGYSSGSRIRTITSTYNRFPLTTAELEQGPFMVAVNVAPTEEWGVDALVHVRSSCSRVGPGVSTTNAQFDVFNCPAEALVTK